MNLRSTRLLTDLLILAGFCAVLYFFGLGALGLTGADEPRYAQIAREMLARHDWVTPVLYGKPWLEKPILYYWEAMLSFSIFGVSDWAARIPAAVDYSVLVLAVYFFIRRFWRGVELDAALIVASCAFSIGFGHAASTDAPLATTFSIAMLAWCAWYLTGRRLWLAGFYVFMALGTLAKGPIAVFLAVLIIVVFAALCRSLRLVLHTLWLPGIGVYLAVALPWYVLVQLRTGNFFRVFILEHNLERYATPVFRHVQPFWYFLPVLLLGLLPWTALAAAGLIKAVRESIGELRSGGFAKREEIHPMGNQAAIDTDVNLFLVLWGVLPVLFFSLSKSKLPGYILPAIPPFALLVTSYLWRKLADREAPNRLLVLVHSLLAGAVLTAALLAPTLALRLHPGRQALLMAVIAGSLAFAVVAITLHRSGWRSLRFVTMLPLILSLAFLLRMAAPALDRSLSSRPLAHELAGYSPKHVPVAGLNIPREVEYGLAFYRNQQVLRYERAEIPAEAHLLITRRSDSPNLNPLLTGRTLVPLGDFPSQRLEFFWVSAK